jgi:hypothetical protein
MRGIKTTHPDNELRKSGESVGVFVNHSTACVAVARRAADGSHENVNIVFDVPKGALAFLTRFDAGKYPEFDKTP